MRLVEFKTNKTPGQVIDKLRENASDFGFIIREIFDMADEFRSHKVDVDENFEYYSVMVCNPQKAYKSISKKPLRGAVLLPPKQVTIFRDDKDTVISYAAIEEKDVKELMPQDTQFQKGLPESCQKIIDFIEEVAQKQVKAK
ncbi:MAG: DUF302 domain-containing protein [Nanoarchaeota archaeon]